ncbi:MAG: YdeI/OmpD-associated family protein, partial [Blastocatellia bacterium]
MKPSKQALDIPVMPFKSKKAWAVWLDKNHSESSGLWLKLAKKGSGTETVSYAEAIEVALCYGWIDGHKRPHDESWWLQKFTPRGPKSIWSKINRDKAEALIEGGHMKPAGLK